MSITGMPSVMHTASGTAEAAASRIASAANGAGTKMMLTLAPVSRRAASTVGKMGTPSCSSPPRRGCTAATTFVP